MRQLLRTVLIWLVVLAMPVQGLAAATLLHCGPGQAGAQALQHPAQHPEQHKPQAQALTGAAQAAAGAGRSQQGGWPASPRLPYFVVQETR